MLHSRDCSEQTYDVGSVSDLWLSGLRAHPSASCRAFCPSTHLGERMTTLPGVRSSIIIGVKSCCCSSTVLGLYHRRPTRLAGFPYLATTNVWPVERSCSFDPTITAGSITSDRFDLLSCFTSDSTARALRIRTFYPVCF